MGTDAWLDSGIGVKGMEACWLSMVKLKWLPPPVDISVGSTLGNKPVIVGVGIIMLGTIIGCVLMLILLELVLVSGDNGA
jgi:hypothetical protein